MFRIIKYICYLSIFSLLLCGCSKNDYNVIMYSNNSDWIKPAFLESNRVRGAYYLNPDYNENDENSTKYYCDKTSPETRVFIIKDIATNNDIFIEDKLNVDFTKNIVFLYMFADINSRECIISKVIVEEQNVKIYYKHNDSNKKDSTMPYHRCLIVTMEIDNVENVDFIYQ